MSSFFRMNIFNFTTICPFLIFIILNVQYHLFSFKLLKANFEKRKKGTHYVLLSKTLMNKDPTYILKNFVLKVLV